MDERPQDRVQERYQHHGGRNFIKYTTPLKNDQIYHQYQHKETQTKKTGNGKINTSDVDGEKILSTHDFVNTPYSTNRTGDRTFMKANIKQKLTLKAETTLSEVGSTDGLDRSRNMDCNNDKDKVLDFTNHYEENFVEKKELSCLLNGVAISTHITNGYSGRSPPDNDDSGSDCGYTTPKKWKSKHNCIKSTDHVTREKERAMLQGNVTQDACGLEPTERVVSSRLAHKADAQTSASRMEASGVAMSELPRKNLDSKTAAGAFGKKFEDRPKTKLSSSKDDSWTLFKPPPVFPVDNSSAKIVPKISYASKVKENLNKAAQAGGEFQPPLGRLSQVPMSAVKTITSASFTNGPISGDGNGCPTVGTFFTPAASSIPPAPSLPCGENVASTLDSDCCSSTNFAAAVDPRKCTLFIYPLNPLNMQPLLPSACQVNTPAAQTNKKALGDIFQNQWGLSFINEPNVGPEGGSGLVASVEGNAAMVTFQGDSSPAVAADPGLDASFSIPEPLAQDSVKRTSAPGCSSATVKGEDGTKAQLPEQGKKKSETKCQGPVVLAVAQDVSAELAQASLTSLVLDLSKEQSQLSSLDRGSWGSFDLKAAVAYHTTEMEYLFNRQKQDPKRIVFYDTTKEGPDQ